MITDHRYDAGFPRDDSKGCIVDNVVAPVPGATPGGLVACGRPEDEHDDSEYLPELTTEEAVAAFEDQRNPGDMHEPKPYTGELDWPDVGQFTD